MNDALDQGWGTAAAAVDPRRLSAAVDVEMVRFQKRVGECFKRVARKRITAKRYAANSPMTIALKGSSTPLIDDGDLFASVTFLQTNGELWVGVNRQKKDGSDFTNIGFILHEGASIDLVKHPKVRVAFMMKLRESAENGNARARAILRDMKRARRARNRKAAMWRGYGSAKSVWVISRRPYIEDVFTDPEFRTFADAEAAEVPRRALQRVMGRAA